MGSRASLLVLALALCAGIAGLFFFRRGEPPAPGPAASGAPATSVRPSGAAPAARPDRRPTSRVEPPGPGDLARRLQSTLVEAYEQAQAAGSGFDWLKLKIDGRPATEAARRERVLAFRLLPAAAAAEPARREEILALLRGHLGTDQDPDARLSCAAALGGAKLHLHDDGTHSWFWAGELQEPGQKEPELGTFDVPLRGDLRGAFARETDPLNRMTLVQILAEKPAAGEADFFREVLREDRDASSREYAAMALAALPPSPESIAALRRALDGDTDPLPRAKALAALVELGAVDDLVAARLIATAPADPGGWELIGKAWSTAKPPPVGAYLRQSLESSDPKLRGGALHAMAASGDASFVPFIEVARQKEPDASLRKLGAGTIQTLSATPNR